MHSVYGRLVALSNRTANCSKIYSHKPNAQLIAFGLKYQMAVHSEFGKVPILIVWNLSATARIVDVQNPSVRISVLFEIVRLSDIWFIDWTKTERLVFGHSG